eukprot:gnl/TRDRNA2_/TRDRNA2_137110_c0_seq1.p1 gnl/TRDRNA2_/TRDRNA2_137110_c0~~gnl/TRDRNA2_/TRDRNA2_137110_c0_seq1.p1  ORF type:complete len:348 (+),score=24.48 gnl/TRDRNA2_/TRDRNA2_137110_c0_seq1:112-1155(+)
MLGLPIEAWLFAGCIHCATTMGFRDDLIEPSKREWSNYKDVPARGRFDWTCAGCRFRNFVRNKNCHRCWLEKTPLLSNFPLEGADAIDRPPPRFVNGTIRRYMDRKGFEIREGDWICARCNEHNFARQDRCHYCKLPWLPDRDDFEAAGITEADILKAHHLRKGTREPLSHWVESSALSDLHVPQAASYGAHASANTVHYSRDEFEAAQSSEHVVCTAGLPSRLKDSLRQQGYSAYVPRFEVEKKEVDCVPSFLQRPDNKPRPLVDYSSSDDDDGDNGVVQAPQRGDPPDAYAHRPGRVAAVTLTGYRFGGRSYLIPVLFAATTFVVVLVDTFSTTRSCSGKPLLSI